MKIDGGKPSSVDGLNISRREHARRLDMLLSLALESYPSKKRWEPLFTPLDLAYVPALDQARCNLFMASIRLHEGTPLSACEDMLLAAINAFRSNDCALEESMGWAQLALLNAVCGTLSQVKAASLTALAFKDLPKSARYRLLAPLVESLLARGEADQLSSIFAEYFAPSLATDEPNTSGSGFAYCGMAYMQLWLAIEKMGLRINTNQHLLGGAVVSSPSLCANALAFIDTAEEHLRLVPEKELGAASLARMLWGVLYALRGQLECGLSVLQAEPRPTTRALLFAEAGVQAFMLRIHGRYAQALAVLDQVPPMAQQWHSLQAHCLFERSLCLQHVGDFCGAHGAISACAQINMALRRSMPTFGERLGDARHLQQGADDPAVDMANAPTFLGHVISLMSGGTIPWADMNLNTIADAVGVSRRTVQAALLKYQRRSFTQLRRELRMRHAERLLKDTDLKVDDVSALLGYATRSLFYSDFRAVFGQAPLSFRRAHLTRDSPQSDLRHHLSPAPGSA